MRNRKIVTIDLTMPSPAAMAHILQQVQMMLDMGKAQFAISDFNITWDDPDPLDAP